MSEERRAAKRKQIRIVECSELTSLSNYTVVAKLGHILDASITGLLIEIQRDDIIPENLKKNLSLDNLLGQHIALFLPQMNIDLDGVVTRTEHKGKGNFHVAVEFSADIPLYWRECLIDLLPNEEELNSVSY